jgi:hypothetical protein
VPYFHAVCGAKPDSAYREQPVEAPQLEHFPSALNREIPKPLPPRQIRAIQLPSQAPLMRCFKMADGLNTMTRRGGIGTSAPVLGLRPILERFHHDRGVWVEVQHAGIEALTLRNDSSSHEVVGTNWTIWPRTRR